MVERLEQRPLRCGTYWGPGVLVGQGAVFAAFGLAATALLIWSGFHYGWGVGTVVLGLPAALFLWAALWPRVRVRPDAVTMYSYLTSTSIPREGITDALECIRTRSVPWFYGADLPELALPDGTRMLLPTFDVREHPWIRRLSTRFLSSPDDLASLNATGVVDGGADR